MKKNFFEQFCLAIVRPQNQLIVLLITSVIVIGLGYYGIKSHAPQESAPPLFEITPQKIQEWHGHPSIVKVGLHINNWTEFDIVKNDFTFDGIIWFQFDPSIISIETISKFSFEKGNLISKSKPDTRLLDGLLFAEYKIRVNFTTQLVHRFFPLDDHTIFIVLTNTFVEPREIIFKAAKSGFTIARSVSIPDWLYLDHNVETGYGEEFIERHDERKVVRHPKAVFSIEFYRSGISLILLVLLPIFLIFFIGLFSFSFDPKTSSSLILRLTSSALTSLIAYRFVIQTMAPRVGYFLLSDHLFTFFLGLLFLVFVISVGLIRAGKLTPLLIKIRGVAFICFHILFILMWYYLIFNWMKQ